MKLGPASRRFADSFVHAMYVPTCATCNRRGSWVCESCAATLAPIDTRSCDRCGVSIPHACECAFLPPEITRLRSAYPFRGWVRDAIHRLKFDGERARAPMLAGLVAHVRDEFTIADGIVPVPIHQHRLHARGFNQTELLARTVSDIYGIPVLRALDRVEDRGSQVGRSSHDRWHAVSGVFACSDTTAIRNRRLIVLDDVITTGATISSCAQELIRGGAAEVRGVSIARG